MFQLLVTSVMKPKEASKYFMLYQTHRMFGGSFFAENIQG